MKKQNYLLFLASVMLVAMSFASCKSSNKPAAETSRIGEIPEALQDIVGLEKYDSLIDYSLAQELIEAMTAAVHQFVGDTEQSDDLTMLAFRIRK